jgi:hypothetical protein
VAAYISAAALLLRFQPPRLNRRWLWGSLVLASIGGVALQIAVQSLTESDPLSGIMFRTTSPYESGYQTVAMGVEDLAAYLRSFPQLAPDYLPHAQRHPPGLILYFYGLRRLFQAVPALAGPTAALLHRYRCEYSPLLYVTDPDFASAVGGVTSLALNAIAVIPLFAAARRLFGEQAALAAALLSPLVPAYALWAGVWDQAFVLVTCVLLWLLLKALVDHCHWAWWLAGGLLSIASFFTHAIFILAGFAVFYAAWSVWTDWAFWRGRLWQLWVNGAGFLAATSSIWFLYWVVFGVSYLDVYRATTGPHFAMGTHYLVRLFYSPYDFILFLGPILGLLALAATVQRMGRIILAHGDFLPTDRFIGAVMLTLFGLTVSGLSRAEVGRVWTFLMPLVLLAALGAVTGPGRPVFRWSVTAGLLASQLIVLQTVWFGKREIFHPHDYALPPVFTPANVQVDDDIELIGYQLEPPQAKANDTLNLTLYWRTQSPLRASYTVFAHVYAPTLGLAAQADAPPDRGDYPTTCWLPGEVVGDRIPLPIRPEALPGQYELIVGMYDPANNNQRLPTAGVGARDQAVVLTRLQISAR